MLVTHTKVGLVCVAVPAAQHTHSNKADLRLREDGPDGPSGL
jgi:hypothetical protein